jgi:hypothetical protein
VQSVVGFTVIVPITGNEIGWQLHLPMYVDTVSGRKVMMGIYS